MQFEKLKENYSKIEEQVNSEINAYIESNLFDIQAQYDKALEDLKANWQQLKVKMQTFSEQFMLLSRLNADD